MTEPKPYDAQLREMKALAQKIWPDGNPEVFFSPLSLPEPCAWVERNGVVILTIDHENALHALHAALLVMAGGRNEAAVFDSGRRFEHAHAWYLWQERLAHDLEVVLKSMTPGIASVPLQACIQTLRERGQTSEAREAAG